MQAYVTNKTLELVLGQKWSVALEETSLIDMVQLGLGSLCRIVGHVPETSWSLFSDRLLDNLPFPQTVLGVTHYKHNSNYCYNANLSYKTFYCNPDFNGVQCGGPERSYCTLLDLHYSNITYYFEKIVTCYQ